LTGFKENFPFAGFGVGRKIFLMNYNPRTAGFGRSGFTGIVRFEPNGGIVLMAGTDVKFSSFKTLKNVDAGHCC